MIRRASKAIPKPYRAHLSKAYQSIMRFGTAAITGGWTLYSRLFLISDLPTWSISWDMRKLSEIARIIGVEVAHPRWFPYSKNQAVFYGSHFQLLENEFPDASNRIATAYFHGRPDTDAEFHSVYERLCHVHHRIHRVQVSHSEMRDVILNSGIDPGKVFLIPVGIDLSYFSVQTAESRRASRAQLGIPESAVAVGSFQKDGVGWNEGFEPKLIKGPDVFLRTIEILKSRVPGLFIVLSGPARGYIKRGLERLGVPYIHRTVASYPDVGKLYQALDVYIVTSRQEGGPKSVLEAMASGVPLVTTRVGQAMDLVRHGENGWMTEVEDSEALAYWAEHTVANQGGLKMLLGKARQTAEENSYEAQIDLWRNFMKDFVNFGH